MRQKCRRPEIQDSDPHGELMKDIWERERERGKVKEGARFMKKTESASLYHVNMLTCEHVDDQSVCTCCCSAGLANEVVFKGTP